MWGLSWFNGLLFYLNLKIIIGFKELCSQERSQRGMPLLNHTYKSLYTANYYSCLVACIDDSQCTSLNYWWYNSQCDLNNRSKYLAEAKFIISDTFSTYLGFTMRETEIIKQVYRSCRHVPPSSGDGEYSIDPTMSGNPFTVYCDMTTDGGGWTAIQMVSFEESKLHLETPSISRLTSSYKDISNYKDHRQKLSQADLVELRNIMGFKRIRFYCHKKEVGTVVHFMTNLSPLGEAVVKYFIDSNRESTRPQACGSYTILLDDSSKLTKSCSKLGWNGTHADGKWSSPSGGGALLKPMKLHGKFRFQSLPSRRDCDDWKSTNSSLSAGDIWAVFVR